LRRAGAELIGAELAEGYVDGAEACHSERAQLPCVIPSERSESRNRDFPHRGGLGGVNRDDRASSTEFTLREVEGLGMTGSSRHSLS
jgi:hypothetical protein